ncbi:MAG: hypothetical protein AAGC68_00460 [Verrucomicrobiota bacterium]
MNSNSLHLTKPLSGTAIRSLLSLLAVTIGLSAGIVQADPNNDSFSNPSKLIGEFDVVAHRTTDGTREAGEPEETGYRTTWLVWKAPASGRARFNAIPTDETYVRPLLTIWKGTSFADLALLGRKTGYLQGAAITDVPVAAGETYYVCVANQNTTSREDGNYECSVVLNPNSDLAGKDVITGTTLNDRFNSAVVMEDNTTAISYTREAIIREAAEPIWNPNYSSWYKYTASEEGTVRISTAGSEVGVYYAPYEDQGLFVYQVNSYGEMVNADPITSDTTEGGRPDDLSWNVSPGETFYICYGLGRLETHRFSEGDRPENLAWRVFTLQFTADTTPDPDPTPDPEPEATPKPGISITSPGAKVGRSFSATASVSNPAYASRVVWVVNGRATSVSPASVVKTKRYRSRKSRGKRPRNITISAYVYDSATGAITGSSAKVARSKFGGHK